MDGLVDPASHVTLPASWYTAKTVYELERRAIFSKHWLLITHESRLELPGAYAKFVVAGFPFFIIRDRQGVLRAFLNVCRHRAFPVVQKDEGTASILACKYHGWSYGINGKLAKAPQFDKVDGFDPSAYSLFAVHLKIDYRGFVWINLDAAEEPSVKWEQYFAKVDQQQRLSSFNMSEYKYDHSWSMEGEYNWKTLIDNYNECYHCSTAHPGIAKTTNLSTYDVKTINGYIEHYAESKQVDGNASGDVAPTFLFPNASITMTGPYFYLMRVVPVSETKVSMQYEVYRGKTSSDEDFESMDKFFKQVESEDKFLCTNAQINLKAGGYVSGPLHPHNEKGVIHFQQLVKTILREHRDLENRSGTDVTPARREPGNQSNQAEESFCRSLCASNPGETLVW